MSVDDHGLEAIRKSAELITPPDLSEQQIRTRVTRVTSSALPDGAATEATLETFRSETAANLASILSRRKKVVIRESSVITYTAYAAPGTATSDDGWEIHRTLTQGDTVTTDHVFGILDNRADYFTTPNLLTTLSVLLDGINDYVNFGNAFLNDVANQWSYGIWIKQDNQASRMGILSKVTLDASVNGLNLQITTGGRLLAQFRAGGAGPNYTGNLTVPVGAWTFIVLTYGGGSNLSNARFYVNATVDTTPASTSLSSSLLSGQDFRLGIRGSSYPFSGNLLHFTAWSKQLSAAEVTELYNAGAPTDPTSHSFSGDLVTWCKLGDDDSATVASDSVGLSSGIYTNMSSDPFEADVP